MRPQVSIRYRLRPGENPWQSQYPNTHPQVSPVVLEKTVQLVTQRAREALNVQCETARRALLHQQREFLAATHHYEAAAMQNLVFALARNIEAHNYQVSIQVRRLEQEAGARFSQRQRDLLARFPEEGNQDLGGSAREIWRRIWHQQHGREMSKFSTYAQD